MRSPLPLREENLHRLADHVSVPGYDRAALRPGVVHISVGSFHRSHQAVYFDDLATLGERDWGIVGVGLRRPDLLRALSHQDGLYTVVERGAEQGKARVVGAMTSHLLAPQNETAVLAALTDERTALVTLTITGAAYQLDPAGAVAAETPLFTPAAHPAPSCAIGYITEALDRRRRAGRAPFTVVSCDNLPGNGDVARAAVVSLARRHDERLASWIEERVEFPNGMVDRITRKATMADRELVARDFGVLDRGPVITEAFSQWVLEDRFCNRRPPLDLVGVQFVDDVTPYALMKTRLLNASHCAIGFLGSLAGLRSTDRVMREQVFADYVRSLMDEEIAPLLPDVPGVDLASYTRTLLERLANPAIADDLQRLRRAASSKFPSHVLPSIVQAREQGREHRLLTIAVAAWLRALCGKDELGRRISFDDPLATRMQAVARASGTDPRPLLWQFGLFGELAQDLEFADSLEDAFVSLERDGVRAALAACLEPEGSLAS
ncbi:MAG TPA: mannitol dehydrogenase family protein [Thermoleophilaceae bacterium]|nr:mannitol dehydrogenase family protein [Thermoleophilaceae bacterium]